MRLIIGLNSPPIMGPSAIIRNATLSPPEEGGWPFTRTKEPRVNTRQAEKGGGLLFGRPFQPPPPRLAITRPSARWVGIHMGLGNRPPPPRSRPPPTCGCGPGLGGPGRGPSLPPRAPLSLLPHGLRRLLRGCPVTGDLRSRPPLPSGLTQSMPSLAKGKGVSWEGYSCNLPCCGKDIRSWTRSSLLWR